MKQKRNNFKDLNVSLDFYFDRSVWVRFADAFYGTKTL